ncbi:hypothetical protein HUT19_26350 [Streptomyces sp. NA02950]|uniref:hypothetical protein n=1 Tax=Streptomyces sp. NA02950 TaxID=2742137 RepID=UPI001591531B|nr:hypothetical protein [Streptomyces sp. NA02950]QKV94832.1 hypothetical protein HUT19_26350 [Streptomyces sp. NA02950]
MNIGKTAALVTATAGAVMFGGGHALADPVKQGNQCETGTSGVLTDEVEAGADCLNFAHIFGDLKSVTQKNHCDSTGPSHNANVVIVPLEQHCSNIAIGGPSSKAAASRFGTPSSMTATGAR